MVFSCVREEQEEGGQSMAMGPERSSKPLHNFTLPCTLKWANQRYLRCMKVQDSPSTADVDHRSHRRRSSPASRLNGFSDDTRRRERVLIPSSSLKPRTDGGGGGVAEMYDDEADEEEGIEAVREKIMNDLKTAADKMKDAIFREETVSDYEEEEGEVTQVAAAQPDSVRPWNLRTRRAACKAPVGRTPASATATPPPASKGLLKIDERRSSSPMRNEVGAKSPMMLRAEKEVMNERPKFSVSLTKKEIEEDFMVLFNHRPPRRPKKRPRAVQKQLDV